MASQNSGPLDWFQCAELSDHRRDAWSTQKPTVLGRHCQEVDLGAVVGRKVPRRLRTPAQAQQREHESGRCVRCSAPRAV